MLTADCVGQTGEWLVGHFPCFSCSGGLIWDGPISHCVAQQNENCGKGQTAYLSSAGPVVMYTWFYFEYTISWAQSGNLKRCRSSMIRPSAPSDYFTYNYSTLSRDCLRPEIKAVDIFYSVANMSLYNSFWVYFAEAKVPHCDIL
jgi:hypothetical protein